MPSPVAIIDLRSQIPDGVVAAGPEPIRLTWRVGSAVAGLVQEAYEVEAAADASFTSGRVSSGVVASADQVAVPAPGGPLMSREVRHHRVRIKTSAGWTDWSPTLRTEAGLLRPDDWTAQAITLPDDPGRTRQSPSPVLRRAFDVRGEVVSARLYATAMGVYALRLNGAPVSDGILAPGWTAYRHRLVADTYDVTAQVRPGANVLVATLGDGWWRGRLGWNPGDDRGHFGRELGLVAQLELTFADGSTERIVTDGSWRATTAEIRSADLYDGSVIDLRLRLPGVDAPGFDTSGWVAAAVVPFDVRMVGPRLAEPVREVVTIPVAQLPPPDADGVLHLDAGQNISGWLRIRVAGAAGQTVTVQHAEWLEPDGRLHLRALRSAKATDHYTLAHDAETVLEPAFTFHGFRYATIATTARVLGVEFVAISSDTPRRGHFRSAHAMLDRFHENVVWSQRDNFVSVPTDCPQRDERFGWTGDAQAFAPTASTLFDCRAFWESWMIDVAADQDPVLGVPSVVPDVVLAGDSRFGRAGWSDAATIVPWAVYESFGDDAILRRQLPSMVDHVESLRRRLGADGLLPESMQFGDWLDPDAPVARPWEAKADSRYLANAFFAHSARLLARAAGMLGDAPTAASAQAIADEMTARTWATWADHAVATQTGCAVALDLEIAPAGERARIGEALAALVQEANGRVATGFLGTPLVLPALAATGHWEEAYLMLLRTDVPSWLYQVKQGATTVWERWDAIRPDGSIHPGTMTPPPDVPESGEDPHMLSFNHYAYGACIDWVYRHVAGLAPDVAQPGYRHVVFAPRPAAAIPHAEASVESPYGRVAIGWRLAGDALETEVELPFGTMGTFVAPVTAASAVTVDGGPAEATLTLGPGRHTLRVTSPAVVGAG